MSRSGRACLVLGGRNALQRIEPAIEQALNAVGLERVQLPPAAEIPEFLATVDVVLADVSRVSPSISFELGAAATIGVPIVYLAAEDAQVPFVFNPVLSYSDGVSDARLAFSIAKALEDALAGRTPRDVGSVVSDSWDSGIYRRGQRFAAAVVHVRPEQGFVLAAEVGRKPVLLPFSRMIDSEYLDVGERVVREGDLLLVEVETVDADQDRVTVTEAKASSQVRVPRALSRAQAVLRAWALLEPVVDAQSRSRAIESDVQRRALDWASIHPRGIKRLRLARNRLTHGELVEPGELDALADVAEEVLATCLGIPRVNVDSNVADLMSRLSQLEEQLLILLRRGGGSGWVESRGLRGLAIAAERAQLIHPETSEAIIGLTKARSELAHGDLRRFDADRMAGLRTVTNVVLELVDERLDRVLKERAGQ
jgi:hypothetical protein